MAQSSGRRASSGAGRTYTNASYNRKTSAGRNRSYRGSAYVDGNTVRKLDVVTQMQEPVKRELSHAARKNRDKAVYMNLGYVLFLTLSLLVVGVVLIGYIRLQSDLTSNIKTISRLESQLNSLKVSNDEEFSRVQSSINLDDIRRIAITELGMTYAGEGQIVGISEQQNDYVKQYTDIKD